MTDILGLDGRQLHVLLDFHSMVLGLKGIHIQHRRVGIGIEIGVVVLQRLSFREY